MQALAKLQLKRRYIMNEMVTTEHTYIQCLDVLVNHFMHPALVRPRAPSRPLTTARVVAACPWVSPRLNESKLRRLKLRTRTSVAPLVPAESSS